MDWRATVAFVLIGAGIILLVFMLLDDGSDEPDAATTLATLATTTTTTTTLPATTTTTSGGTSTTVDPEVRKAEIEQILEELELGRLDAIHDKDEGALLSIMATQRGYDAAVAAMDVLAFAADPSEVGIEVTVIEVLLDRADCLAVYNEFDGRDTLGEDAVERTVSILWPRTEGGSDYRLATVWSSPSDLWRDDCDVVVRTEFP